MTIIRYFYSLIRWSYRFHCNVAVLLQDDELATQHKLDFRLVIPCRDFLVSLPCSTEAFTKLLTDGDLASKYSKRFTASEGTAGFRQLLTQICFYAHMFGESMYNSGEILLIARSVSCKVKSKCSQSYHFCFKGWCKQSLTVASHVCSKRCIHVTGSNIIWITETMSTVAGVPH